MFNHVDAFFFTFLQVNHVQSWCITNGFDSESGREPILDADSTLSHVYSVVADS